MEDASKALFIAAGILIGILVLSLGVYLFVYMSGETGKISVRIEENQLQEFNEQFLKYQNKSDLTIYDIISVANLATEYNIKSQLKSSNRGNMQSEYIAVIKNNQYIEFGYEETKNGYSSTDGKKILEYNTDLIQKELNLIPTSTDKKLKKYTCSGVSISSETNKVYLIRFD